MRFDIKTVSEANSREHWRTRNKRKQMQQYTFSLLWHGQKVRVKLPATITFTRFSCMKLDSDNLAGAFKGIRDQLAKEINVNDGDERITWLYKQERIPKREHTSRWR